MNQVSDFIAERFEADLESERIARRLRLAEAAAEAAVQELAKKAEEQPDIEEERLYVDKDAGSLHDQLFIEFANSLLASDEKTFDILDGVAANET